MADVIRVKGLRDLNRAFARADTTLKREKNDALKRAAEPVRVTAEQLAVSTISRIRLPWSRMRVGVTQRSVYVAPATRGTRAASRRRPNLAPLLLAAEEQAVDRNRDRVVHELDEMLRTVGRTWER